MWYRKKRRQIEPKVFLFSFSGISDSKFLARKKRSRFSLWACACSWKCWINCFLWGWRKWNSTSAAAVQKCFWKFNSKDIFWLSVLYIFLIILLSCGQTNLNQIMVALEAAAFIQSFEQCCPLKFNDTQGTEVECESSLLIDWNDSMEKKVCNWIVSSDDFPI